MLLQNPHPGLRNTIIRVNSTDYKVDAQDCVETEIEEDIDKLRRLSWREGEDIIRYGVVSGNAPPAPGPRRPATFQDARAFLDRYFAREDFRAAVSACGSFQEISAYAESNGMIFTRGQLAQASDLRDSKIAKAKVPDHVPQIPDWNELAMKLERQRLGLNEEGGTEPEQDEGAEESPEEAVQTAPPKNTTPKKKKTAGKKKTSRAAKETTKHVVPKAGESWPDPDPSMEMDFLSKMADAYKVTLDADATKGAIVAAIHSAMYDS